MCNKYWDGRAMLFLHVALCASQLQNIASSEAKPADYLEVIVNCSAKWFHTSCVGLHVVTKVVMTVFTDGLEPNKVLVCVILHRNSQNT